MDNRENESDGFVSAADFFRQQGQPPALHGQADLVQRKPPRESLLVVARNSQVKNKISAFDKHQHQQLSHGSVAGSASNRVTLGRPVAQAPGRPAGVPGRPPHGPLPRRAGAAPSLGAIAEEAASIAAAAAPARRHAAVVSTAGAPARRHAEPAATTAPARQPPAVLPSPGTKQQLAEKQHEARFPSIMFHAPQPTAASRAAPPLGGVSVLPPVAAAPPQPDAQQPHPLPSVLAAVVRRSSLSPRRQIRRSLSPPRSQQPAAQPLQLAPQQHSVKQPYQQLQDAPQVQVVEQPADVRPKALAAALEAEAAAPASSATARSTGDSDDDHFVDADSGAGSGAPSVEGSAVWADARESHHPASPLVIHDGEDDDAASVASDASTVVPEHEHQAPAGSGSASLAPDAAFDGSAQGVPEPVLCESPLLGADATLQPATGAAPQPALAASAASELFQSASSQLPTFDGSLEGPVFGSLASLPPRRSSLSPALSAGSRRSSLLGAQPQPEAGAATAAEADSVRVSLEAGVADVPADVAVDLAPAAQVAASIAASVPSQLQQPVLYGPAAAVEPPPTEPEPAPAPISAFAAAAATAPSGEAAGSSDAVARAESSLGPFAEASKSSMASSTLTAAPSLSIEFAEASLRYSVDYVPAPQSPHSKHPRDAVMAEPELPPAASATPQHSRLIAVAAASPAAPANTPATSGGAVAVPAQRADAVRHSMPVPASAVALAIEQAAAESRAEQSTGCPTGASPRASSAASVGSSGAAGSAVIVGGSPATAVGAAASPVPATPYAATEYDGDDVVMMDADFTPAPTTGRRPLPGASRFQQEALASVARAPTHAASSSTHALASGPGSAVAQALAPVASQAFAADEAFAAERAEQPASGTAEEAAAEAPELPAERIAAEAVPAAGAARPVSVGEEGAAAVELPEAPATKLGRAEQAPLHGQALLPLPGVEAHRARSGRLSMPASWQPAGDMRETRRNSRLSLPSGFAPAAAPQPAAEEQALVARHELALSHVHPVAAAQVQGEENGPAMQPEPDVPEQMDVPEAQGGQAEQLEEQELAEEAEEQRGEQDVQPQPQQEEADQQEQQHAVGERQAVAENSHGAADGEDAAAAFAIRSRLLAEDKELFQADLAAQPVGGESAGHNAAPVEAFAAGDAAADEPVSLAVTLEDGAPASAPQATMAAAGPESPAEAAAAEAPAPEPFAAKPRLALSPAHSSHSRQSSSSIALPAAESDDATAFAPRPKLATSPAVSSGSILAASASTVAVALSSTPPGKSQQPNGHPTAADLPAAQVPAALPEQEGQAMQQAQGVVQSGHNTAAAAGAEAAAEDPHAEPAQLRQPATLLSNPLAGAGDTPAAASSRRFSHSPAPSGLSAGAISNNPMFAGTPSHPTPPSVNLKSFLGRTSFGGTPQSAGSNGSSPASVGMQLAERMHQVAEQLQKPAAPQGLASLATPAGARLATAAAATPATAGFQFAADVEAMLQALEARTPATALGQQPALGRAAAMATTVQRARVQRYSFAAGPSTLVDLDGYDANGDKNAQAGPTPLFRQQLLSVTPAAAAAVSNGKDQRAGDAALVATPAEVTALREENAALRKQLEEVSGQREEMVALLGGYQSSIRQLQDQHSAVLVALQGELATVKADKENLKRVHADTDKQFRTLYSDKYQPLKAEAAGLRLEAAALQQRLAAAEQRARQAADEAQAARQELAAAADAAAGYTAALQEQQADAAAARDAQQRLQQQLAAEQQRAEKVAAAQQAELEELRGQYGALTEQYDEAVHRINLAKQARERAQLEAQRKEEEVVALEVRLKDYEAALREYKKENSRFFEVKERLKGNIAELQARLQKKEEDNQTLLAMCNELVARLEREGLPA